MPIIIPNVHILQNFVPIMRVMQNYCNHYAHYCADYAYYANSYTYAYAH